MTSIDRSLLGFTPLPDVGLVPEYVSLPERHTLPPDGHGVESHFDALYPTHQGERQLLAFARPSEGFHDLLRPQAFCQALAQLRQALDGCELPALVAAANFLNERGQDEQLLSLARHLLHKA